jgi:hypothetical protein
MLTRMPLLVLGEKVPQYDRTWCCELVQISSVPLFRISRANAAWEAVRELVPMDVPTKDGRR